MKKFLYILILLISCEAVAQRANIAYVDMAYILKNIPAYETANEQLNMYSTRWQREVDEMQKEVQVLTANYQTEQIFLTDAMRKERENEILEKEQAVLELQRKYFGVDGELFKKRESLLKPIQDEIYMAIQEVAAEKRIEIVKDRSSDPSLLYIAAKMDISEQVLAKISGAATTQGVVKKALNDVIKLK